MLQSKNAAPLKKDTSKVSAKEVAMASLALPLQLKAAVVPIMASRDYLRAQRLYEVAQRIDVRKVGPKTDHFFDTYIHDSMAGFIGMNVDEYQWNGSGIVKFRSVFKGNDFSLQRAAEEKAKAAADYTVKKAQQAATYAKNKAQEAADYAARKAEEAKAAAMKAYDAAAKALQEEALAAQKKANEAAIYAQQKAHEAAELAKRTAAEAQQAAEDGWKLFWNGNVWVAKRLLRAVVKDPY
jgi:hypothetical protein